jgi:hypothetical protein
MREHYRYRLQHIAEDLAEEKKTKPIASPTMRDPLRVSSDIHKNLRKTYYQRSMKF